MNLSLFLVGLAKAGFGIVVGALAIYLSSRALHRLLRLGSTDQETREGNVAAGVLTAGSLIALGILVRYAIEATFNALDLLHMGHEWSLLALRRFGTYALLHVSVSVVVSAAVLALGTLLFAWLTRGVDEMAEVRKGNVAPAIVLAAVMVVLALMTAPGLQTALDGLLPLPELGRNEVIMPS